MKAVETNRRTGGFKNHQYNSVCLKNVVTSIDEFLNIYKPKILSDKLRKAVEKAFDQNGSVTFNCGFGNQTFYFSEL